MTATEQHWRDCYAELWRLKIAWEKQRVAQSGSASALEAEGRRFESDHADQFFATTWGEAQP